MKKFRSAAWRAAVSIPLAVIAGHASAQNFDRIAPKEPVAPPPPQADIPPPNTAGKQNSDEIVVGELKGLVFISNQNLLQPHGAGVTGLVINGVPLLQDPDFAAIVNPYFGKPLTFAKLHEITHAVINFSRDHGHPLVKALAPRQDVSSGTIQIVVTEFLVGEIAVEGNQWFRKEQVTAPIHLNHGDEITTQKLTRDLDSANANPFRRVDIEFKPSDEIGYTDLVLKTQDRFPLRVYGSYDNSGNPVTGRDRWALGFNWGNAFWADELLSYQLTTSDDFWHSRRRTADGSDDPSFLGHSISWSAPLPWGDTISIFGAYEETKPNLGEDFGLTGQSGQASIRYNMTLPPLAGMTESLQLGYDFKTTNNNLDFGGTEVSRSSTEIDQFLITYSASRGDAWGSTAVTAALAFSPGGLTGNNDSAAFQPAHGQAGRSGATADYVYFRPELDRLTELPAGLTWSFKLIGQLSERPLLNSEQLSFGGADLLRGYDPNSINGDEGVVISNELRSPIFSPFPSLPDAAIQLLAFWDYAALSSQNIQPGDTGNVHASSVGLGLRANLAAYAVLKLDYGWQLQRLPGEKDRSELGMVSLTVGY